MAKIKLDNELLSRARKAAEAAGYSSLEEFITHVLEKELRKILPDDDSGYSPDEEEKIRERLRGLGYIS